MKSWIQKLTDLTIVTRLAISFAIFTGLVLALWLVSTVTNSREADADDLNEEANAQLADINAIQVEFYRAQDDHASFLLRYENQGFDAAITEYFEPFLTHLATIVHLTSELQEQQPSITERQHLATINDAAQDYQAAFAQLVNENIPARIQHFEEAHETLEAVDEMYSPTINGAVYANIEEVESQLALYANQTQPGHTSLREFAGRQSLAVVGVQTAIADLRAALETEAHPIRMPVALRHLTELEGHFAEVNETDRAIAVEVEELQRSIIRITPAIQNLINSKTAISEDARTQEEEASRAATTANATAVIVALVLGMTFIFLSFRHIAQPIARLKTTAQHLAEGDYSQPAAAESRDEIGQLATAFNEMVARIQQREEELLDLNQSLEQRVLERTYELESAVQHAQEANRLKDEFLATMSHELRTPLNAIIGFQGILTMSGRLDEKSQFMVERTRLNATRLLNLINDILDLSRIEAGRLTLVQTPLSLREIAQKIRNQIEILTTEKELTLNVSIDEDVPEVVYMDEDAISKILTNLMANAVKFTKEGHVDLSISTDSDHLLIEVNDTGIGIPAHMHQIIFDRFRQVDGSYTREFGGSGLGLAIVQELCHAMNGTIRLTSEVGRGTTFIVELPLITKAPTVEAVI